MSLSLDLADLNDAIEQFGKSQTALLSHPTVEQVQDETLIAILNYIRDATERIYLLAGKIVGRTDRIKADILLLTKPFTEFWAIEEAIRLNDGDPTLDDHDIVFQVMGAGGSYRIHAGDFRALAEAVNAEANDGKEQKTDALQQMMSVVEAMQAAVRRKETHGTFPCPRCGGDIHYSIEGARSWKAECTTLDCILIRG